MDMPFIDVKASCTVTGEQELRLKAELGRAVALLPGKSEESLMLRFTDNCRMWFAGAQHGPIVMLDAAIYGSAPPEAASAFGSRAVALCKEVLGAETVYFKLAQTTDWAW